MCSKVGHYSYEREEPSESDDELKDEEKTSKDDTKMLNNTTMAIAELDKEYGGAWAAEAVEKELDWFERAVLMMDNDRKSIAKEIPMQDWFDEVVGDKKESRDEGGDLKMMFSTGKH
jgi:hypothetical protein